MRSSYKLLWVGVSVLLVCSTCPAARATTINVPDEQSTITAAIGIASPGDTILVAPGEYNGPGFEFLDFGGKDLVLLSSGGPEATTIYGNDDPWEPELASRGLIFRNNETAASVVDGFTFKDFATLGDQYGSDGPALTIEYPCAPTIRNCIFDSNTCVDGYGGAVRAFGGTFENCIFTRNHAEGWNAYGVGGAIDAYGVSITECQFIGNGASPTWAGDSRGGAIRIWSEAVIERCLFIENVASYGGAIYFHGQLEGLESVIRECTISANWAHENGGGICIPSNDQRIIDVERSIIWNNGPCDASDIYKWSSASDTSILNLSCCVIDSSRISGNGIVQYDENCIFDDPQFCDGKDCDGNPSQAQDYRLSVNSPGRPENSPCGLLIGAIDEFCDDSSVPAIGGTPIRLIDSVLPNPAAHELTIQFNLLEPGYTQIEILDISGRKVRELLGRLVPGGRGTLTWNLTNVDGIKAAPGVYFIRLTHGQHEDVRSIVLAY